MVINFCVSIRGRRFAVFLPAFPIGRFLEGRICQRDGDLCLALQGAEGNTDQKEDLEHVGDFPAGAKNKGFFACFCVFEGA